MLATRICSRLCRRTKHERKSNKDLPTPYEGGYLEPLAALNLSPNRPNMAAFCSKNFRRLLWEEGFRAPQVLFPAATCHRVERP